MEVLPDRVADAVLDEVHRTRQRAAFGPWRTRSIFRAAFAAAAVVAMLALAGALLTTRGASPCSAVRVRRPVRAPARARPPSLGRARRPRQRPARRPGRSGGARRAWTRIGRRRSRAEPAGGAKAVPILWTENGETGRYQDPTGDTESDDFPWVDIHAVSFCHNRECPVVWVPGAPNVDPTEQWMAYGIVADDDGDGVADRRIGIDNIPGTATDPGRHRAWITDLHTGQTASSVLNSQETPMVGDTYFRATFPAARHEEPEQPRMSPCSGVYSEPIWMRGLSEALVGLGGGDFTGGGRLAARCLRASTHGHR